MDKQEILNMLAEKIQETAYAIAKANDPTDSFNTPIEDVVERIIDDLIDSVMFEQD